LGCIVDIAVSQLGEVLEVRHTDPLRRTEASCSGPYHDVIEKYRIRIVIPEVKLIPLDAGEFERLAAQYRSVSGKLQPALPPVTAVPAQDAASE
jgi:hypothetical protein